jgi:hypothetical protein
MKLSKAISKAEKLANQNITNVGGNNIYQVTYKGYKISFCANGRASDDNDAVCYSTTKVGLEVDTQSDYFPMSYFDNLTQCFKHVDRMAN